MVNIINLLSLAIIPLILTVILIHGMIKKVDIYEAFVKGAKEGLDMSIRIMPYLIAIFISIGIFKSSGAFELFVRKFAPVCSLIGIPVEVLPMVIMKPISGSGSLGVLNELVNIYGADSYIGRTVSTIMGSAETIFYTIAVYFGAVGIKNTRHTLLAALIAHLAGVIAAVVVCKYL